MLTELAIRNFAIIDELTINFDHGLTVLTGETGAGKSIIIDAVQLLAGERASVQFVRHGADKAEIEGLFSIEEAEHQVVEIGALYGIDVNDAMIVLHRTITANGKSICRVNGKLVTLSVLKEIGSTLIDIHTQHETQSLMNADQHIHLLDLFDGKNILSIKEKYLQKYNEYLQVLNRYKELSENEKELSHRLDLLEFQYNEINQAELSPDEDIELEEERSQLANYEKIFIGMQSAYNALYSDQKALEWLNEAQMALQSIQDYNDFIQSKSKDLTNHYYNIEELAFQLRDHLDQMQYDEERLNEIETRLSEIDRLKRKYGTTVNEILDYQSEIEEEINQIHNKDSHLASLELKLKENKLSAYELALELHQLRKKSADALTKSIHKELNGLYMENAQFFVDIEKQANKSVDIEKINLHKNGLDHVQFKISTNIGEPLKALHRIASGGELSRIMLVMKTIFAKHQGVTSVIFDEVDTGVSGRVAQAMAEKIYRISEQSQVLCITHLPQVAAMADAHMLIKKLEKDQRTSTTIEELSVKERVNELSRMITGKKITDTAKEHGKKLLDLAKQFKKNLAK